MQTMIPERPIGELHPPATRSFPEPARPRWSRRRKTATAACAAAAVLGPVGLWWVSAVTGDPGLAFEGALNVFRSMEPGDKAGIIDTENALGHEAEVDLVPGGRFVAWVNLRNNGSHDLRIKAIPTEGFYSWGLDQAVTAGDDADEANRFFPSGTEPMRPFTLPAGGSQPIRLDFRFANCAQRDRDRGAHMTLKSLTVNYSVLGVGQAIDVPFEEMAITVPGVGMCDQPILDPPDGL